MAKKKKPLGPFIDIGRRVQRALDARGMSATEFREAAAKLDSKRFATSWYSSTTSNITNGDREPTARQYAALAEVLQVSRDWLAEGKGPGPDAQQLRSATPATPGDRPNVEVRSEGGPTLESVLEDFIERKGHAYTEREQGWLRKWFRLDEGAALPTDRDIEELLRLRREVDERRANRAGGGGAGGPQSP